MIETTAFRAALIIVFLNGAAFWLFLNQEMLRKKETNRSVLLAIALPGFLSMLFLALLLNYIFFTGLAFHFLFILAVFLIPISALVTYSYLKTPQWTQLMRMTMMFGLFLLIAAIDFFWYSRNYELPFPKTIYADNYTKHNFVKVEQGMNYDKVVELLGEPLITQFSINKQYYYPGSEQPRFIQFKTEHIENDWDQFEAMKNGVLPGSEEALILAQRGEPERIEQSTWITLHYSKPFSNEEVGYWRRMVIMNEETRKVRLVISYLPWN